MSNSFSGIALQIAQLYSTIPLGIAKKDMTVENVTTQT